jgi:hypothetical protein
VALSEALLGIRLEAQRETMRISIQRADLLAENWTSNLQNMKQKCYIFFGWGLNPQPPEYETEMLHIFLGGAWTRYLQSTKQTCYIFFGWRSVLQLVLHRSGQLCLACIHIYREGETRPAVWYKININLMSFLIQFIVYHLSSLHWTRLEISPDFTFTISDVSSTGNSVPHLTAVECCI